MKNEDLYKLLGEIDDDLITEASEPQKRKILPFVMKLAATAAAFALILLAAVLAPRWIEPDDLLPPSEFTAEIPSKGESRGESPTSSTPVSSSKPHESPTSSASAPSQAPSVTSVPATPSEPSSSTPSAPSSSSSDNTSSADEPQTPLPPDEPDEPDEPDDPPVMKVYKYVSKYESAADEVTLPKYYGVYETYQNENAPAQRQIEFFDADFDLRYDSSERTSLMKNDIDLYVNADSRFSFAADTDHIVRFQALSEQAAVRITDTAVTKENLRAVTDRIAENYIDLSRYSFRMTTKVEGGVLRYNCTYQRLIDGVLCDDTLTVTLSSDGALYALDALSAGVFDDVAVPNLDLYTCDKLFETIGYKVNYARYTLIDGKAGLLFDCNIPDGNGGYSYGQTLIITE